MLHMALQMASDGPLSKWPSLHKAIVQYTVRLTISLERNSMPIENSVDVHVLQKCRSRHLPLSYGKEQCRVTS